MPRKNSGFIIFTLAFILLVGCGEILAGELSTIKLFPPRLERGKLLMQALKMRESRRDFSDKPLPLEVLSDLLWAANGINRPDLGKRTAPTAMNLQEIDIYCVNADGVYLYDAKQNILHPILAGNIRAQTGRQPFVGNAALNLLYVADFSKMQGMPEKDRELYAAADTGFISQNVYLFCASEGLATVVRGWFDGPALAKLINLRPDQRIILTQSLGYPKE